MSQLFLGHTPTEANADLERLLSGIPAGQLVTALKDYLTNIAVINIANEGAKGDGSTDDAAAWNRAIAKAIADKRNVVEVPAGALSVVASQITIPEAITIRGTGFPPGGIDAAANGSATVLKDFLGDLFVFNGANGGANRIGGGVRDLRIVATYGTPSLTGGSGRGIVMKGIDAAHTIHWFTVQGCILEECFGTHAPWTWAIDIDGSTWGAFDIAIRDTSVHASGTGGLRLNGTSALVHNSTFFNTSGSISLGDTDNCNGCLFSDLIVGAALALDRCTDVVVMGVNYNAITTTANMSGVGTIFPGRLATPFVDNTNGLCAVMYYDPTIPGWTSNRGFASIQGQHFTGKKSSGPFPQSVDLIGLDVNNVIRVGASGDAITAVGAVSSYATAAVGDAVVQGAVHIGANASGGGIPIPIMRGTGSPEGVVAGRIGTMYIRDDGGSNTTLYLKQSTAGDGTTGWKAL